MTTTAMLMPTPRRIMLGSLLVEHGGKPPQNARSLPGFCPAVERSRFSAGRLRLSDQTRTLAAPVARLDVATGATSASAEP